MDKKRRVKRIFDSISYRYDFLNHFLSAGIDFYWRKKALKLSGLSKESILLDVACGTGDFSIAAKTFGIKNIFGLDLSINMLRIFNKKSDWIRGHVVQAVAEEIPFKEFSFTNIIVAFGVRNFFNIADGFRSFFSILMNGGKVTVLEFKLPKNKMIRNIYTFYFNRILPFIGRIISKDKEAYKYLPDSVDDFDKKVDLKELLAEAGFTDIKSRSLTFGIVQIVTAEKAGK